MISVCMATFNGIEYIQEQIESIRSQLSQEDELIISDDGSTDGTLAFLQELAERDTRVCLLSNPSQGVIENFSNAIAHSSQELIFLCDQDDIWFPNKVQRLIEVFAENPKVDLIMSDLIVVDQALQTIKPSYQRYRKCHTGFLRNIIRSGYIGAGIAFRSRLKEQAMPIPVNIPMHDMWLGLLADARKSTLMLAEPLVYYRKHSGAVTDLASSTFFRQKLKWRTQLIYYLLKRILFKR